MHIGICAPYDLARDGGVNTHIRAQARALRQLGHRVCVFGAASAPLAADERRVCGCISPVIGGTETGMGIDPRAWWRVRRLFADEAFDVLHVHEPLMPIVPWCAVLQARVPIVATFHTHREHGHRFYPRYRAFLAPLMRRVGARFVVSRAAQRTVEDTFPGAYELFPNGIESARFHAMFSRPPALATGHRHVLCVGRLEPRKGLDHLVDAMAIVQATRPDVRLAIVGDGPDRERIRARAVAANVDVLFTGRVPDSDLPAYYRHADVVCCAATGGESFGIVLLEAMAAGRPVVATSIEGYVELAGGAEAVRFVPPGDAPAMAVAIAAWLDDDALRARVAQTAPSFTVPFDWTTLARQLEARYGSLSVS
jgi:phosphatidylinositol alpha-mannosyltransferase